MPEKVKTKYIKVSPTSYRYASLEEIAKEKKCSIDQVVKMACDFYIEFRKKRLIIISN